MELTDWLALLANELQGSSCLNPWPLVLELQMCIPAPGFYMGPCVFYSKGFIPGAISPAISCEWNSQALACPLTLGSSSKEKTDSQAPCNPEGGLKASPAEQRLASDPSDPGFPPYPASAHLLCPLSLRVVVQKGALQDRAHNGQALPCLELGGQGEQLGVYHVLVLVHTHQHQ